MSEPISAAAVAAALKRAAIALTSESGRLNDLDQLMGDGDIGITLEKIGIALTEYADTPVEGDDLGKWLGKAGMAANKAGSSSYGTLLATALMRAGKAVTGKSSLAPGDLAEMFNAANAGVQERGKAHLGDKTVVDALDPAAVAFAGAVAAGASAAEAGRAAVSAAEAGRDLVTPLRSRIGRASWVGERTEGKVDPGCEAFVVILRALADG